MNPISLLYILSTDFVTSSSLASMRSKGVCPQIQVAQAHFEGLFREMMRNGGCQCHAFLQVVSLRKQGRYCNTNVTVLIKFTRQPWLSTVVLLLNWKFQICTWHFSPRLQGGKANIGYRISDFMYIMEKFSRPWA